MMKDFLIETRRDLEDSKVEIILSPDSHVLYPTDDLLCNGYFITEPLTFAVGTGKELDLWLPIYAHEYCHFRQWKEEEPVFRHGFIDGVETFDMAVEVMEGKREATPEEFWNWIRRAQSLEADCERRAQTLIEAWELPIDSEEYAQKANSYLHFYTYIANKKKWYAAGKEPYNVPEVWQEFNTSIDTQFETDLEYNKLFEGYCI